MSLLITAAICSYQRHDLLAGAVRSLLAQHLPVAQRQIIIVDNSPPSAKADATAAAFQGRENLLWLRTEKPGLSHARNMALAAASAPIIAFMDDDAFAEADWLTALVRAFAELGETVHAVGGMLRRHWASPRPAWLTDRLIGSLGILNLGARRRLLAPDEAVMGANIAFRRDVLASLGGFDTSLGRIGGAASLLSGEENAVLRRIRAAGGQIAYEPTAVINHIMDPNRLTRRWFRRRFAWEAVSEYLQNPEACFEESDAAWAGVKAFLLQLPPADRSLRGLALAPKDNAAFEQQLHAIAHAIQALLAGIEDHDDA